MPVDRPAPVEALYARLRRSPAARVAFMCAGGFAIYGGYALAVNLLLSDPITAIRAGLGQGTSSAVSTLIATSIVELAYGRLRGSRLGLVAACLVPPTLTAAMHAGVQIVLDTPDVLATIALSVVVGYVFSTLYVLGLIKAEVGGDAPG